MRRRGAVCKDRLEEGKAPEGGAAQSSPGLGRPDGSETRRRALRREPIPGGSVTFPMPGLLVDNVNFTM